MDQFTAIRVFLRYIESGSLTRAAAQLGMPKSTASKLLAQLEAHLGAKLINRSTRSGALTKEGSEYYREVGDIMARLEHADSTLTESRSSPRGRVRVDVHSALANSILIPTLAEFREAYPHIQLAVGISDRPIRLIEEAADCVIRLGKLPDASLVARQLFTDTAITCASPAYLARKGVPKTPADLAEHHDVVGYFSAASGEATPLAFRRGEEVQQIGRASVMSNDSTGLVNMVLAGLGVGQIYELPIKDHISRGLLVPVLQDWETFTVPISLMYPPAPRLNRRVRVFADWIIQRFAEAPT